MRRTPIASVGVDLGGTRLRVCAVDASGRTLAKHQEPAPTPDDLGDRLRLLWRRWRIARIESLVVGSRGIWTMGERRALAGRLRGLARRVAVMSDVELTFGAALGGRDVGGGTGILLIAGTGAISFGRNAAGRAARAGGLGPLLGDEGSGYWIGREYLRDLAARRGRWEDARAIAKAPDAVRRIAALSSTILKKSPRDAACARIVARAVEHLVSLVRETASRLGASGDVSLALAGGLFTNARFKASFLKALKRAPGRFQLVPPPVPAERAAALMGLPSR
jgi:N-acetylglucosamine kinase-like BadF-type ATPase